VPRKGEVVEIGRIAFAGRVVVVVADGRPELVAAGPPAVASEIRRDELVVPLPHVVVDGGGGAVGVVVVADGGDEIGTPALDQVGDVACRRGLEIGGDVADDGEV